MKLKELIKLLQAIESQDKGNYNLMTDYGGSIFKLESSSIDVDDSNKWIILG